MPANLILAPVRVRVAPHPLRADVFETQVEPGGSLLDILGHDCAPEVHVWIGEREIGRDEWPHVIPQPGEVVAARVMPHGGSGKNPLRTVLTLAAIASVAAMPASLGGSAFLGALARGAVGMGASLLINALIPPQVPKTPKAGPDFQQRPGISGIQNQMRPYEAVPRVYGQRKVYPPLAARPYTEIVGQDQYLRLLFSFGYGPLDISDIKIGETPISQYEDADYEIGSAPALYSADIWQEDLSVALNADSDTTTRTSQTDADELSIDFVLPQGLWGADKTPETPDECYITLRVEYRPVGGTWANVRSASGLRFTSNLIGTSARQGIDPGSDKLLVHGALKETGMFGLRWRVAPGQYEVRVTRVASGDPTGDSSEVFDDLTWTALRTIRHERPVTHAGQVLMGLRIKATDQLNGMIDQLNAVVQSRLKVWNGSAWVEQASSNAAWVYADILAGTANARPIPYSQLDVASLSAWAAENWQFHHVYDSQTSVFDAARDVAAAGRAAWAMINGKYGVVRDTADPAPIQVFTPRNSRNFESRREFHDQPHALRARFINADGEQDEITVYDDGFNSSNATKFEVLDLLTGIKDQDTAWRLGRYHIAQGRLRPFTFTIETDFEHLVAVRGDTVLVAHDEPMWGSGWGRIRAISGATITLDDTAPIDPSTNYVARLRLSNGTIALRNIVSPPGGDVSVFELESVPAGLAVGDLVVIGIASQETRPLKLVEIEPGPDLSARLRMVDVAPEIYDADTGPIPPYEDRITLPLDYRKITPPAPVIVEIRSDSTIYRPEADGTFRALVQIAFRLPGGVSLPGLRVEGRFIRYDNSGHAVGKWQTVPAVESADGVINFERVSVGKTYRFEIRTRNGEKVSPWAGINHTVLGGVRRKIVSFRQETAPTASESFDGDRWVKPSTGEEFEWRDNAWVPVATHDTPARLLEKLTGQITESQLNQDLSEKINLTYDAAAIEAMLLTGDASKVHQGDTPPASPATVPTWIDTSGANPVLKRWNGSAWVVDNTAHIDSLRTRITTVEGDIDAQATAVSDLDTRVTTVEGSTTVQSGQITALSARLGAFPVLVENGGFENGLVGWSTTMPIQAVSVPGDTGAAAGRIIANASYTGDTWVTGNSVLFDVKAGDRFALSFRATYNTAVPPSNSYVQIYLIFYNSTGGQLFSGTVARVTKANVDGVGGGNNWVTARAITGVPSGAVQASVSIGVFNHTTLGSYWVWDDVRVELIPREGDFPNFVAYGGAIQNLDTRVTSAENGITVTSQATTALSARFDGMPSFIENGGFENGAVGWTLGNWTISSSTPHSGTKSAQIAAGGATNASVLRSNRMVPVAAGDRVMVSGWIRRAAGATNGLLFVADFLDANGGYVRSRNLTGDLVPTNANEWQFFRTVVTVFSGDVAGAPLMRIGVSAWNSTGGAWAVDDIDADLLPRESDFPGISANGTAISQLGTRVTATENSISVISSDITSLSAEIDDINNVNDAQASAIASTQAQVNNLDGEVSALTTSTNAISARVGTIPAIIENGSFENGGEGWYLGNWTINTDPTLAHSGSNHARIAAGGATSASVLLSRRFTHVSAGERVMMSGWLRRGVNATNGLLYGVNLYNGAGTYIRTKNIASGLRPSVEGTWEFFRVVVTILGSDVADGVTQLAPFVSAWDSTGGYWAVDDLRAEILPREGDFPTISANSAAIAQEQQVRADADSALASDITTVSTTVNGHTTTIQQHTQSINGLEGQYTVKIDTGGRVIGFGLASGPPDQAASSFLVKADRFAVGAPGAASGFPFIVDTAANRVVMDNAFIRNLTIDRLATGGLSTLVADGSFEAGTRDWSKYGAAAFSTNGPHTGAQYLYTGATGAGSVIVADNNLVSDIVAGETVLLEGAVKYTGGAAAGSARIVIRWQNASGGAAGFSTLSWTSGDMAGGVWLVKRGMFTAPAGTVSMRVRCETADHTISGTFWNWDSILCRRSVGGTLIEQDAVSAGHVKARVLTADKLVLGGITYEEVGLNQMTVPVFAYGASELTVPSGGTRTTHSVSITTINRPVQIFVSVEMRKDGSTLAPVDFVIKRGSTTLVSYTLDMYGGYFARTMAYVDTAPGSGSQTYSVDVTGPGVESYYRRRMITVSEVRR